MPKRWQKHQKVQSVVLNGRLGWGNLCQMFRTSWFIFTAKEKLLKYSYIISLDAPKCEDEDAEFDVYIETRFKATKRFQYTHFSSCHPSGVPKGFVKGEAFRILRTNSSETAFKTAISHFKTNLIEREYPETLVSTTLAEITLEERKPAHNTQYRPLVPNLKQILKQNWHIIQQKPLLKRIFKYPPIVLTKGADP